MNEQTWMLNPAKHENINIVREASTVAQTPAEILGLVADASACIQKHGIVLLERAIPEATIAAMLAYFHRAHGRYTRQTKGRLFRNYQDDPKRAQIPVAPVGALANPLLYANGAVMAVVHQLLGTSIIIGEMGGVISHPGAEPQYTHRDSNFLFGGIPAEIYLPPCSISLLIPLLDVPYEMGPTEYWPGSHRITVDANAGSPQCTAVKAGSVYLWDARLMHRGGPNRSQSVRPAVYITYQRPWYFERSGYESKPPVLITKGILRKLPAEHRGLFEWALRLNHSYGFVDFFKRAASGLLSRLKP